MPEMLVLNPRRKRRTVRAKAKKRTTRRRRRARNPIMLGNPSRRRRAYAGSKRRRRARRTRNPRVDSGTLMKGATIAGGAIVTSIIASQIAKRLPESWKANADMVRIGTKAAVGIGLPMVLRQTKVLPGNLANAIALGGAVATVLDVFDTYVKPNLPMLADYEQGALTGMDDEGAEELSALEPGMLTGADASAYGASAY